MTKPATGRQPQPGGNWPNRQPQQIREAAGPLPGMRTQPETGGHGGPGRTGPGLAGDCPPAAVCGPHLPSREDLDIATAASAAALADPAASLQVRHRLLEAEEATFLGYLLRPGAAAELEAGI